MCNEKWILELNGELKRFESLNYLLLFCFRKIKSQTANYKEMIIIV